MKHLAGVTALAGFLAGLVSGALLVGIHLGQVLADEAEQVLYVISEPGREDEF